MEQEPRYISTECRVGYHEDCWLRRIVPNCSCSCHWAVNGVVWTQPNHIALTYDSGLAELRPGNRELGREMAECLGLKAVEGTPRGREEWVRGSTDS